MSLAVLVRGAGVTGLVTALSLAEAGAAVTLVETAARVGAGASWQAGGMLAPWCEAETAPREILDHAEASIGWWLRHVPGTLQRGSLVLAPPRDAGELERFARRTTGHEWLGRDAIEGLEPSLAGRFGRALFFAREAHLDPRAALPALAEALIAQHGCRILLDAAQPGEVFEQSVDCRGLAGRDALAGLRGVRGEMVRLRCPEIALSRPVRLLHPRTPVYLVPRPEHIFMAGATMVESEAQGAITVRAMLELLGAAYTVHPAFAEAEILESGIGVRPSFADNMPRVQRTHDGEISVNGVHRHGFLLAPVLAAEVVARLGLRPDPGLHR